ncbi:hypothetical protein COCOBI_06-1140 [Coccomyxa sp. Obi]|nr:hypothetical protein COCOBI_06-1140 [Coccomyxa sp. Obi]
MHFEEPRAGSAGRINSTHVVMADPLIMDNGRDLVDMICSSYESPLDADEDEHFNFSNFRVVVLRKGAMCVSAATLRVFGTAFAELPFAVESRLASVGVQYMIVPSMRQLLGMWRDKFGYVPLTLAEAEALDDRIVSPDSDSAQLLKKALGPRKTTPPHTTTRALRSSRCRETGTPQRQSEQRPAKTDTTSAACYNDSRGLSAGSADPAARASVPARPFPVPELGPGWTKTCRIYQDSKRRDMIYRSPQGSTFRSMKQAAAHAESIATKPASSVVAANEAAEPSAAAMSKVAANLTSRADPSASKGVVMSQPVIPPATASVRPLTQAPMQSSAGPSVGPSHLPPTQPVRPPSTANTARGLMPPPPPRVPRPHRTQAPARPLPTKAVNLSPPWHHVQQDATIAEAIAKSVRQYVSDLHEETLQKNEMLANENARLRDEIEALKCLARQTPSHSSPAAQAEPRTEAHLNKDAHFTAPPTHAEGQEIQAMGIPLAAASPEAAAADAPAEAPEGSAAPNATAESHQPRLPSSAIGAQRVELPSTPVSESSVLATAPMPQALPVASASVPSEPSMVQQQDDAAHRDHSRVYGDAAALGVAPDETLCTGAPTVIMEQSALVLATVGPRDSGDASPPLADCGRDTHAATEEPQELAQEMDWEAVRMPDPVATAHMQGDCHECDTSAGEDSCGKKLAIAPEVNAVSREEGPGSQHFQAAEDHAAQAATDVHGLGGNPVQAAAEMQAKLGSVVELVSAVRGGFSPHDAAGALLHNLQDVLSEIQQDAARIADQLSGALPARQSSTRLPDGCNDLKSRGDVTFPAQPATQIAHAPSQAQEQPVTSMPAAANHLSSSADPEAQPHEEALAGQMCSGHAHSGPQQGSAEPAGMMTPLVDFDINAPGLGGSGNVQEQDRTEQQQHRHGDNAMVTRCTAGQGAPAAAVCGGGTKTERARHSWPGAVQRVVRSVFSLGIARLAPCQHTPGNSVQPAASGLQACVAVGMKKAQAGVESVANGIEEAQKEGMQVGRGGKEGHSKTLGAEVIPCIPQLQRSGEPASCPQSSNEQELPCAGRCMGSTAEAADPVTEPEDDVTEAATAAADSSEMEDAQVLVSITHSQADTMEAMQPAVATQLATPTDSHLSQPRACSVAPCSPSPHPSQLPLDCEALARGPTHVVQQPPFGSKTGGKMDIEAPPSAMAAAAAAATVAPRCDERGASCKRANEDGSSVAWSWALAALPIKRAKTTHTSDVILEQVEDSKHEDAVEINDCQSDTSVDAALQQTALFCDQLGSRDDD